MDNPELFDIIVEPTVSESTKFVFFENKEVVYGGLTEYAAINELEFWEDNGHVCYDGHKIFIDEYSKQIEKLWKIK